MADKTSSQSKDTYKTLPTEDENDPTTWCYHLNELLSKRKAIIDIKPTFQDEWSAHLQATAEFRFHREEAQVQNNTINLDTISDEAMSHVMQMSNAELKSLKIYYRILRSMRVDLARMDEVEALCKKILALSDKLKAIGEVEKKRTRLVALWVQKTRSSIFHVLAEFKKNLV